MNVALVEHAEQDIDRGDRGGDQNRLIGQRLGEDLRGAGKTAVNGRRHANFLDSVVDFVGRVAERRARLQIEGNGGRDEQSLMTDR